MIVNVSFFTAAYQKSALTMPSQANKKARHERRAYKRHGPLGLPRWAPLNVENNI